MNSPTKFAPRTAAPRPPLPSHAFNPLIASSRARACQVPSDYREGQDIIVGRVKIPTPNGNHAFILRRFDTGAISLSTMFRAAFPTAGDEAEKVDSNWVKTNYDLTGANGGGKLRLAARVCLSARARIAPVSPLKQTPLSTMREESPATAPTELEQEQEPDVPGPSMEEDIAESKALIARLQREKEEAEAKAQELAQELAETASEPAAPVVVGAKRTREEATPPPTFNFDRQLVDTSDRQIVRSRAAQQANRRSAMWGAVAFAVGLGVTSVLPNLFF
ncbi:hypothetical protein RHS01_07150 [Rhizoctonia solani]|uniref:Uncharacterized protein n=1 Tax=Rhizoctonia solani TaxID=456999 RepID=A0A8H7I9H4_9AGAM|nr:hypothetical protein RHS01_07150 [Rhizoctonia solani]